MSYMKLEFTPKDNTYSKISVYKHFYPETYIDTYEYTGKDHYVVSNDFIITIKVNAKTYFERMHEERLKILKNDYNKYLWYGNPTKLI